jgi:ubiquitin carboxyl-terminal hydrolase 4/11/15
VVTPAAYLLFYRRRSDHPLGGPKLEEMLTAINAPPAADSDSRPTSRDASPSGEGPRLGDSSHNGSSSAFTTADQVRHVGDGGSAPMQIPGAYHVDESLGRPNVQDDEVLPGYEETQFIGPQQLQPSHMDLDRDEAIDVSYPMHGHQTPPWEDVPGWGFHELGSGRAAPSQMIAVPPGSVDFNQDADADEDLFENADGASTKVEGGDGSSAGNISDIDERMKSLDEPDVSAVSPLIRRNERESAPPPHMIEGDDEEDELPVVELRVDDEPGL